MKTIIILLVLSLVLIFGQEKNKNFFPLEIDNKWHFDYYHSDGSGRPTTDTLTVIVKDYLEMPNGKYYYELNKPSFFYAKYLRVDSNCVFVYDEFSQEDVKLIDFEMKLNEQHEVRFGVLGFVELYDIDSIDVLGYESVNKTYRLDGLILSYLTLSSKFGPIWRYSPGEPPGTSITRELLIGCQISDTSYGHIVSVKDEKRLPNEFSLSPNYPNPFNPTTKIKFSLPNVGDENFRPLQTQLIVYDILGREIKTLLNKPLQPGEYEVEFDATGLPSGVYFYRLSSGSFSQTKKMVLLR